MFPFADGGYPEEDHTGLWVSVGVNGEKSSLKEPVLAATSSPLSITLEDHNLHLKHKVGLEQAAMPATQQCGEKLPAKGWLWPKMVNNTDPFFVPSASFKKAAWEHELLQPSASRLGFSPHPGRTGASQRAPQLLECWVQTIPPFLALGLFPLPHQGLDEKESYFPKGLNQTDSQYFGSVHKIKRFIKTCSWGTLCHLSIFV